MSALNPALLGWAARQLGQRIRAGEPAVAEISTLLTECKAHLAVRHAATFLRFSGTCSLLIALRRSRSELALSARLAVAHALLSAPGIKESEVSDAIELLEMLLQEATVENPPVAARPQLTLELLQALRVLPLPAWTNETSVRPMLLLLSPPVAEDDDAAAASTTMASPDHFDSRGLLQRLTTAPAGRVLPGEACQRLFSCAGHSPVMASSLPALTLNEAVALLCAGGDTSRCTLCAASALVSPVPPCLLFATGPGTHPGDSVRQIAEACTRLSSASIPLEGIAVEPSSRAWASAGLGAMRAADAIATSEAASRLLATVLVLNADGFFHAGLSGADEVKKLSVRIGGLLDALAACEGAACHGERLASDGSFRSRGGSSSTGTGTGTGAGCGPGSDARPSRPFRLPRCEMPTASASFASAGDLSKLVRRQWDSLPHAVLDTLLRAAAREGGSSLQATVLEALREAVHASGAVRARILGRYAAPVLRRHLRPPPSRPNMGATPASSPATTSSKATATEDHQAVVIGGICATLTPEARVPLLAASIPTLLSGTRSASAHFSQALPLLDGRLHRLRSLTPAGEESFVLTATACANAAAPVGVPSVLEPAVVRAVASAESATGTGWTALDSALDTALDAALDAAGWLQLRARGGLDYAEWLAALIFDERLLGRGESSYMVIEHLRRRLRSGWELPAMIRIQCVGAARAAAKGTADGGDGLSKACSEFLNEAVAFGIQLPHGLRSLQPLERVSQQPGHGRATSLPRPLDLHRDAAGITSGMAWGVAQLLELQRRGDSEMRRCLEALLSSDGGEAQWRDFVQWRLPHQMLAVVREAHATEGEGRGGGSPGWSSAARRIRRQLALLLARLVRWSLPHRDRLRELLEPLPESLRGKRGISTATQTTLELEGTVRAYLHGDPVGEGAGATAGAGLLPNVSILGATLLRRACTDEELASRSGAASALHQYQEWWPMAALASECRKLVHAAGVDRGPAAAISAVRALETLLALPCHPGRSAPLPPVAIDWSLIFDATLVARIHVAREALAQGTTEQEAPLADGVVETLLEAGSSLSECVDLRRRLSWLLARPAVGPEAKSRLALWLRSAQANGWIRSPDGAALPMAFPMEMGEEGAILGEWVRWELESMDSALPSLALDDYSRRKLSRTKAAGGLCLHGGAAATAEEVFTRVVQQTAACCAGSAESTCELTDLPMALMPAAAARVRLLRVCAELGEGAALNASSPGAADWMLRAIWRVLNAVEVDATMELKAHAATGSGQSVSEEPTNPVAKRWRGVGSALLACIQAVPWECLAPPLRRDGAVDDPKRETGSTQELLTRLLSSPILQHAQPLLVEVILALARRHHLSASNSLVPQLILSASSQSEDLSSSIRHCVAVDLPPRVEALPHLAAVAKEMLLMLPCTAPSDELGARDRSMSPPDTQIASSRKRNAPEEMVENDECGDNALIHQSGRRRLEGDQY